jgi:hypothetical protein
MHEYAVLLIRTILILAYAASLMHVYRSEKQIRKPRRAGPPWVVMLMAAVVLWPAGYFAWMLFAKGRPNSNDRRAAADWAKDLAEKKREGQPITPAGEGVGRSILLAAPFLAPLVLGLIYAPINASWTIEQFGCGCPVLGPNGVVDTFNANEFNLILWICIFFCCAGWKGYQVLTMTNEQSSGKLLAALVLRTCAIAVTCLFLWGTMLVM